MNCGNQLWKVRPSLTVNYLADLSNCDIKFIRQSLHRPRVLGIKSSNREYITIFESCSSVALSGKAYSGPSLSDSILNIVFVGPEKQVTQPDAKAIVAVVTNKQFSGWDISISHDPYQPVNMNHASPIGHSSVSFSVFRSSPNPTLLSFLHSFPKTCSWKNLVYVDALATAIIGCFPICLERVFTCFANFAEFGHRSVV